MTGLYGCPNPSHVCVLYAGKGYLVDTKAPTSYQLLRIEPVTAIERVGQTSIVVAAGSYGLLAIDAQGLLWVSGRLCLDDLVIRRLTSSTIHCSGRFLPEERVDFAVATASGLVVGGREFADVADSHTYWHRAGPSPG